MRVNHVGEVCAQALYMAQSVDDLAIPRLKRCSSTAAAGEETDHLAWTSAIAWPSSMRAHKSLLNPIWYAGAPSRIGLVAGPLGRRRLSLGFVVETERQVEQTP